jgi:hypothetical protein
MPVQDDDDADEAPPRRKTKERSGGGVAVWIGAGAVVLLLMAIGVGIGVYFLLPSGVNRGGGNEDPLAYVPSRTEVVIAADGATLMSDSNLGPQLEKSIRENSKSGDFFDSCKKEAGLEFKDLLARTVVCTDLDSFNQGGAIGGPPGAEGMTLILRPSRPFDQKVIARACKNPVRKTAHGKYYYEIAEGDMRTLFMPSDHTLILSTLTADRLDALFASDGTRPSVSADALSLARTVSNTTYSVVIPLEGRVRKKFEDEARQGQGNPMNPMQPLIEQVAKGKGLAIWGTVDGQQVKLGANVLYSDATAAKAASQAAETAWGANKTALGLGLFMLRAQMPKIVDMLSPLTQNLRFTSEGPMGQVASVVGRTAFIDGLAEVHTMQQNGGGLPDINPGALGGLPGGLMPNPGAGRGGRR